MSEERTKRLAGTNFWDEILALRDRQRENRKNGLQVIKGKDLPQEVNRQGLMRWYMHPSITDTVLTTHLFFEQEIPPGSRSGRLKFQGEQVIYILEGKGYTLIDGVKHHWKAGDVLNLPVRKQGIVIQHVNGDPNAPAKFVAAEPNLLHCTSVDRGSGFEQLEDAPEYKRR
jgi:quercetin dioxygenase-like cupin family protein